MIGIKSVVCALGLSALVDAQITMGTAASYGVFAASTITNTGNTVINALIGLDPGTSITGFPPGVNNGEDINDAAATQAKSDITTAYNAIMASTTTTDLTGQDLGGMTLYPGTYNFASSGQLTGTLTLDAQGDASAQFIFKFGSTITTASASQVVLQNSAAACNVFWGVGSSATLGTTTAFEGNVIAYASITATTGVTVGQGGLYAMTAAVTLDTNTIDSPGSCAAAIAVASTTTTAAATTAAATTAAPITTTTTTTAAAATVTTTATVTNSASTTTIYITSTATVTSTSYAATTATATVTSTTTVDSVSTTTVSASACTAAAKMAKRAAKKTKTVTTTCAGKTATVKAANKTKWVSATHTATSTHWVTKKGTSTHTTQAACTTKAKRDYQRMFQ